MQLIRTHSDNAPFVPEIKNESEQIQELARTPEDCHNNDSKIFCITCRNCQSLIKCFVWTGNIPSTENAVKNIHKTYGGDWKGLKNIQGLTGPNGGHFCIDCMASLRDRPLGILHAQVMFLRYSDDDTVTKRSLIPQTFEQVREMAEKVLESNNNTLQIVIISH